MPVRLDHVVGRAGGGAVLAVDDLADVQRVGGEGVELVDQPGALGGAGGVVVDGLVQREGNLGDGVHGAVLRDGACKAEGAGAAGGRAAG